jgi:hypothetical protein
MHLAADRRLRNGQPLRQLGDRVLLLWVEQEQRQQIGLVLRP